MGWNFVKSENKKIRQHIITKLNIKVGLIIIKILTNIININ